MKKFVLAIILIASMTMSYAQTSLKSTLGVVARVNVSTFRTGNTLRGDEIIGGPEVGVNWVIPASPSIGISLEGLYVQTGGKYGTFNNYPRYYNLHLRYAKLPVSVLLGKGDFKVKLGYYEAYLLDKVTISSWHMPNHSFYSTHWIANRSDRGVIAGFDVDLHGLIFTTQGSYGLRRVGAEYEKEPLWNERLVSLSGGLKYNF